MATELSLTLTKPEATEAFARALAPEFRPGDTVLLEGEIGAGKSHFARALIDQRLADEGLSEDIPSPTFTLVQTYEAGTLTIWHCDLYRLTGLDEVIELGLLDAIETALCLIEWPDRLGTEAPAMATRLAFAHSSDPDSRTVDCTLPEPRLAAAFTRASDLPGVTARAA